MNHNPHKIKINDKVNLDADLSNSSQVIVLNMTSKEMLSIVANESDLTNSWTVMTCRLTPIETTQPS